MVPVGSCGSRMPPLPVSEMRRPARPRLEVLLVEIQIEVVRLDEPHEVHGVDGGREPRVGGVDVVQIAFVQAMPSSLVSTIASRYSASGIE